MGVNVDSPGRPKRQGSPVIRTEGPISSALSSGPVAKQPFGPGPGSFLELELGGVALCPAPAWAALDMGLLLLCLCVEQRGWARVVVVVGGKGPRKPTALALTRHFHPLSMLLGSFMTAEWELARGYPSGSCSLSPTQPQRSPRLFELQEIEWSCVRPC